MKTKLPVAAALVLCLFSCKQNSAKQDSIDTTASKDRPAAAKPELFLFAVNVDNLRLREQPGLASQVLAQMNEGDIIEGTGEESSNQDEVDLRGISIRAPYFQVVSSDGKSGWTFGGALTCVYAGPKKGSPDHDRLEQLAQYLKSLNTKKLDSGEAAWAYVEKNFGDTQGALNDASFFLLEQFMNRMEREGEYYTLTDGYNWSNDEMDAIYKGTFNPASNPITKSLVANGFRIAVAEGSVFPIVDLRRFQSFFAPRATPALKLYIDQETAEQNKPMYDDGGVIVPLEEVADLAVFWENFNRNNPYFPLHEQTRESQHWLALLLVNGSDNTPVFDEENDEINEDFKKLWTYVLQKYPQTEVAKTVKQMADLCASEKWKRTKKVEAFQQQLAGEHEGTEI